MDGIMDSASQLPDSGIAPVLKRLGGYAICSPALVARIESLGERTRRLHPGAAIQTAGQPQTQPCYLLEGWACCYRDHPVGGRQIFEFILPGDGIGINLGQQLQTSNITALTSVVVTDATSLIGDSEDDPDREYADLVALAASAGARRVLDALFRIGRMSASERLVNLFLELETRLEIIGHTSADGFQLLCTQQALADALGLSLVHINRTLSELRAAGVTSINQGRVVIHDRAAMTAMTRI